MIKNRGERGDGDFSVDIQIRGAAVRNFWHAAAGTAIILPNT